MRKCQNKGCTNDGFMEFAKIILCRNCYNKICNNDVKNKSTDNEKQVGLEAYGL